MATQTEIKGTEKKQVPELDTAAEAYVAARDARMRKTERETTAREALVAAMKTHRVTVYQDKEAGLIVTLVVGKDKVKVTREDDKDDDEK